MLRTLTALAFGLVVITTCGQGVYGRKHPEIFSTDGKMRRGGFYFAPGLTYTLPEKEHDEELIRRTDTVYSATFDPKGALGLYFEAGWFLSTLDPLIVDYWDIGVAYKQLKGSETFIGTLQRGDSVGELAGDGSFNDQYVAFHLNANKLLQTADYQFVQFSLGVNVDARFGAEHTKTGIFEQLNRQRFPPSLLGQLHLKVGYGLRINKQLMVIPAVETPVFSVEPSDGGHFGALDWFSSTYRPLIFSVRFLFLRYPKGWACTPVKSARRKSKVVNPTLH